MKLRTAIIIDQLRAEKWMLDALNEASDQLEIIYVLNCVNSKTKRKWIENFFYYILNFLSLKNNQTKKQSLPDNNAKIINFESDYIKNWQTIPVNIIQKLLDKKIEVVIKFGMGLLKIDEKLSQCNVLSFHHGNPSKYRGRPAGFYEILNGEKKSGVIVQKLNNELDAGTVYAFAESKVFNYSYKKTAHNFYSISKYLLRIAINNLKNDSQIEISKNGKNHYLPSNLIVLMFVYKMISNLLKKIIYGLFFEKRWRVAVSDNQLKFNGVEVISKGSLKEVPITSNYNFYADPFFSLDGKLIRLEALGNKSGIGDILEVNLEDMNKQRVMMTGKHYSYPYSFVYKDNEYLMPEVASHSSQYVFSLDSNKESHIIIKGLENKRIVDATLYQKDGWWYLFFGLNQNAHNVLNLWISSDLSNPFKPHPNSPICISPVMARMGGSIKLINNRILRFGQNNEGEYGESLSVIEIKKLTPTSYMETHHGSIFMENAKGPHSLNLSPDLSKIVVDYYENKFSFLAGFRRLKAKL
tara:strand:+ start:272 stop:1846 length:1575 start_codon:yes stop_codon:yes gene_type:complete